MPNRPRGCAQTDNKLTPCKCLPTVWVFPAYHLNIPCRITFFFLQGKLFLIFNPNQHESLIIPKQG